MHASRRAVVVAVVAIGGIAPLIGASGCGGSSLLPFVQDETDAHSSVDARVYRDAAPLVPEDSGPPAPTAFVEGWVHVPWAGACALYQPANAAQLAAVPALTWKACVSGRADCQQIVEDWPSTAYHELIQLSDRATSEGSVELMAWREYGAGKREALIWDSVKGITAAWRYDGNFDDCLFWLGDIAAGEDALSIGYWNGGAITRYRQIFGTSSELTAKTTADYDFLPSEVGLGSGVELLLTSSASRSVVTIEGEEGLVSIRDRSSNAVHVVDWTAQVFSKIVGDTVFYDSDGGANAWTSTHGDQILRASTATLHVHDLAADESSLVWLESQGQQYTPTELFVSPFAATPGALARRSLGLVSCSYSLCGARVSEGYALVGTDDAMGSEISRLLLVRLSDGARWTLDSPGEAWGLGNVLNGELWIPAIAGGDTVLRIPLASLGPPDPP